MAIIRGSEVEQWRSWVYALGLSQMTGSRAARLRTRLIAPLFEEFGAGSRVSFGTRILEPNRISVGARTMIPNSSVIDGRGGLEIGDDCLIGFENVIVTATHAFDRTDCAINAQGMAQAPVRIGDDVWTGCRVIITPGVTIGSHAIIGAGSVVTRDIPEWAIAAGSPARVLRDRRDSPESVISLDDVASQTGL